MGILYILIEIRIEFQTYLSQSIVPIWHIFKASPLPPVKNLSDVWIDGIIFSTVVPWNWLIYYTLTFKFQTSYIHLYNKSF